jgi:hypothetical protein
MQNISSLSAIKSGLLLLMTLISVTEIQAITPIQTTSQVQEQEAEAPALIGTESLFFADIDTVKQVVYVLIYDEFWSYDLKEEQWALLHTLEESEMDELLSEPKEFGYDHVSGNIYMWSTGVGLVYRIDLETFDVKRIDRSFHHKNQFGHIPFFRDGKIHAFGGYGFWEDKNLITHFIPEVGEWLIVAPDADSPYPPERVGGFGVYINERDVFYAYEGKIIENREHDDSNSIRSNNGEVWKFDFKEMKWSLEMTPGQLEKLRFPSVGARNVYGTSRTTISSSHYSAATGNWYIPTKKEGGDMANVYLKAFDLIDHTEFKPVQIDATTENAMISTHFLFNEKSQDLVFVGFRNVTNNEVHPLMVLKVPESEILKQLEPADNSKALIYGSLLAVGVLLILGWVYIRFNGSIPVINGRQPTVSREDLEQVFNKTEQSLLKAIMDSEHMPETSELEEMVWPDVDNYDYRRKLRNETIRAINEKAQESFGLKDKLIYRQRDMEDNRRFRYGVNKDLLG